MSHNTTLRELRDSSNEPSSSGGHEAEKCVHNEKNGDIEKENEEHESLETSEPNAQVKVVIVFPRKKLAGFSASEGTSAKVPELSKTHTESANRLVVQEHCYFKEKPPAEGSLQGILQSYCKTEKPKNNSDNQEQVPVQVPRPKILKSKNDVCEVPVCRQRHPHKQLFSISSIMVIRTEAYYSRVCFCEDHFDAADFVDPNVRPLQLKVNVLPHLLRLRVWKCGKWDWAEYVPGCPYALDKPPADTPKMVIERLKKKIQHVSREKLPETTPGMLPCQNEAKICSRNKSCRCGAPPGSETPEPDGTEEVLYYDDDDEDIEELKEKPMESHSDAESWKDSDLEEEEFQKITEQAIHSGRNVRTRRDCKISDWQFLPSRLFMPKSEKPPKLEKKRKRDLEAESAVKKMPCLEKNDKCYYCDEWFPNSLLRSRHMKNVHPEYNLWICGLCRSKLGSKKSFYQHTWNHMKASAYQCTLCDKQFVTKKNYETHCAKHLSDAAESNKIQCPVCSERVDNEVVLATHMLGHGPQETGNASDENVMHLEGFNMSTDFTSTQVVDGTSQNEFPLFTIKVLEDLNQPVSVESVQQVFQCPDCMKVLESQQHLTVHMMNHGLTYKCDTCCETIEGWSNIHQHMLNHKDRESNRIQNLKVKL
ncbi:Hypothetical predicted protein [Cloeon dipterum]|uniref:C2H2-type domain-containing protein n=1 Tax=Cloeon dipterum TaxID=197152 RepID=A0A8S1C6D5_9INSE|nr:Hypothetical predicted protein [Cloeon dipterum]